MSVAKEKVHFIAYLIIKMAIKVNKKKENKKVGSSMRRRKGNVEARGRCESWSIEVSC
jgi:hypothetical protein